MFNFQFLKKFHSRVDNTLLQLIEISYAEHSNFKIKHIYSKDLHVVIGDIMFNFEDYAIQLYVPEIGF